MASVNFVMPFRPAFDSNSIPIPDALVNFYYTGTTTRAPIFTDTGLSVAATNPVEANGVGRFPETFLDDTITYRVRITTPAGALVEEYDPYWLAPDFQAVADTVAEQAAQVAADAEAADTDAATAAAERALAQAARTAADSDAVATAADRIAIETAIAIGLVHEFASTADALSNGVIGYTITAPGSGATNGSYSLAMSGGSGSGAAAKVLVSGNVLTSVTLQRRGINYASAPTVSLAAVTGLSGGAITAIIGANTVSGDFFTVVSGGNITVYLNSAGTAVSQFSLPLPVTATGVLLDPTMLIASRQVNTSGGLNTVSNYSVTPLLDITGLSGVEILGMPPNTAGSVNAFGRWLAADGTTAVAPLGFVVAQFGKTTLTPPGGAKYLQFTVQNGKAGTPDTSKLVVRGTTTITGIGNRTVRANVTAYGGKDNLFDAANVSYGIGLKTTGGNGSFEANTNSCASPLIYCQGEDHLFFSGFLPTDAPVSNFRVYWWLAADGYTIVGSPGTVLGLATDWGLAVPAGAVYFQFSPFQRASSLISLATAKVQVGTRPTAFSAYMETVREIDGRMLPLNRIATQCDTVGDCAVLGDSNATATGGRATWPRYALSSMGMTPYNFAASGASFRNRGDNNTIKAQIDALIAAQGSRDFLAIYVAAGTNDYIGQTAGTLTAAGSVATAQGKSIGALDQTLSFEAARDAFYRLRTQWPDAKIFYINPTVRNYRDDAPYGALVNDAPGDRDLIYAGLYSIAAEYDAVLIDAYGEAGIPRPSVANTADTYFADALHTSDKLGEVYVGNLVMSSTRAAMGFA